MLLCNMKPRAPANLSAAPRNRGCTLPMTTNAHAILTLNAGSSSIKFGIYGLAREPDMLCHGQVERIGSDAAEIEMCEPGGEKVETALGFADHARALQSILAFACDRLGNKTLAGVGHRIAHGGLEFTKPTPLNETALERLDRLSPFAPLHQPHNLQAVRAARSLFPDAVQIGCFDTAFHRTHPWVNDTFALPRAYYDKGIRRYGFHGLSYDYITGMLKTVAPDIADGRVIVAHLGNGASMCAIRDGHSVASTMGFSALDGLPMGTRCGQLDPGVLLYLMDQEGMTADEITHLLYRESGLKGLSGGTSDMRTLQALDTAEAAQAIEYYVFRIRREIGAMAAILGGVDALVFCGGIGENARPIRARICDGMDWIGITLDPAANQDNALTISKGPVRVLVIPTDEERVIARAVVAALL